MVSALLERETQAQMDWEDRAIGIFFDPAASPALKSALAQALERDPVDAVKDAETLYQILVEQALARPSSEWKWRKHPTWCWACNSHNTQLIGAPGYGIVHNCLDCGDQFLIDGTIKWSASEQAGNPVAGGR